MHRHKYFGTVAMVFLALCCVYATARSFQLNRGNILAGRDLKTAYAGSRCLVRNCDLYDTTVLKQVFLQAGGVDNDPIAFIPYNAASPASTLFLLLPITLFPWKIATVLFLLLTSLFFTIAILLAGRACLPYSPVWMIFLLGCFAATSTMLLRVEQTAGLAIGFGGIGVCLLLEQRRPRLGVFCFALSLAIKPHIAGAILLYFLLEPKFRRRAWQSIGVALLLMAPGIILAATQPAARHWLPELSANLAHMAAPGGINYSGPSNPDGFAMVQMQALLSALRDQAGFYGPVTYAISAVLVVLWVLAVLRTRKAGATNPQRDWIAATSILCISFLPIYHRNYDLRIFLLLFPATAILLAGRRIAGVAMYLLLGALVLVSTLKLAHIMLQHNLLSWDPAHALRSIVLTRHLPIMVLLMACILLAALYRLRWDPPLADAAHAD